MQPLHERADQRLQDLGKVDVKVGATISQSFRLMFDAAADEQLRHAHALLHVVCLALRVLHIMHAMHVARTVLLHGGRLCLAIRRVEILCSVLYIAFLGTCFISSETSHAS